MKVQKIDVGETGLFSPLYLDYINQKDQLSQFYSRYPEEDNFKSQIEEKKQDFNEAARKVLVSCLQRQYKDLAIGEKVEQNITSLRNENTFTITTGHQLNIFTGPLYFIYKIVTVINACKELKSKYPEYDFVPVYWMASEDHDFEEISNINLYGTKYVWETEQKGAVGRFDPSTLKLVMESMPKPIEIFENAYLGYETLAASVRCYANALFGEEGLIVIDGDDRDLKTAFASTIKDELINEFSFKNVKADTDRLEGLGYKTQITAREINLFYLDQGIRERIVKDGESFKVLNTNISFSTKEILNLLDEEPEKFSPNVILRPLFQEVVLPNLAYVGGPAEVIYWLQLKSMFDHIKVPFPILLPRNFVMFLNHVASRKLNKTGLEIDNIFDPTNTLVEKHVKESSNYDLELKTERDSIGKVYDEIFKKASKVDATLESLVNAEAQGVLNSLEKIEKKIIKAEKRHHDDRIRQIEGLKKTLFPGGGPQERSLNFLNFYLEDPKFIEKIKSSLSPFDLKYHVIIDVNE